MPKQSCRNCKWLKPDKNKNGKRLVIKNRTYACLYPVPDTMLPDSITKAYLFWRGFEAVKSRVTPDSGVHCPVWELME